MMSAGNRAEQLLRSESQLSSYKAQRGISPEYLEALSWMGRPALGMQQYTQAEGYASRPRLWPSGN